MTVLTTILNGSSGKDVRDTINQLLSTVAALTGSTPLTISGTPGSATQGSAYSFTPTTSGGSGGTKTFSLTGALPAGLAFSTTTGAITGTPTAVGTTTGLNITVTDGAYTVSRGAFSLVVAAVAATLQALTVSKGTATVGTALSSTISGLTSGSSLALTGAGAAGLSISGAVITGTSTTAGAVNIVETLAGATNSPRTTSGAITVAAAASALPQASKIVFDTKASDLSLSDGAAVSTLTDSINGVTGTAVSGTPVYKAAGFNGKPTVRFSGGGSPAAISFGRPAALVAALDKTSSSFTIITIVANIGAYGTPAQHGNFATAYSGGGSLYATAAAGRVGSGLANTLTANVPYTDTGLTVIGYANGDNAAPAGIVVNGTLVPSGQTVGGSSGKAFAIGGAADNNSQVAASGDWIRTIVWAGALSTADLIDLQKYVCDTYGTPGVYPWTGRSRFYITAGNSFTAAFQVTALERGWVYKAMQSLGVPYGCWTSSAVTGSTTAGMTSRSPTNEDAIPAKVGIQCVLTAGEWYNGAAAPSAPYNAFATWATARKTANPSLKMVVFDSLDSNSTAVQAIPRATWESWRSSYNASMASGYTAFADRLVQTSLNANIGVDGAATAAGAATYFNSDLIHPSGTGGTDGQTELTNLMVNGLTGL